MTWVILGNMTRSQAHCWLLKFDPILSSTVGSTDLRWKFTRKYLYRTQMYYWFHFGWISLINETRTWIQIFWSKGVVGRSEACSGRWNLCVYSHQIVCCGLDSMRRIVSQPTIEHGIYSVDLTPTDTSQNVCLIGLWFCSRGPKGPMLVSHQTIFNNFEIKDRPFEEGIQWILFTVFKALKLNLWAEGVWHTHVFVICAPFSVCVHSKLCNIT